jgi:hypothetical protein
MYDDFWQLCTICLEKPKRAIDLSLSFLNFLSLALSNRKQETRKTNIFTVIIAQRHYDITLVEKRFLRLRGLI